MRGPMPHPHQFPSIKFALCGRAGAGLACAVICWALAAAAHADTPFSCPAPRAAVRQKTQPVREPNFVAGGVVDFSYDHATWGLNGNGTMSGHVTVRQGQRVIQTDDAEYASADNDVRAKGKVDYEDPLIHLTGSDGRYSTTGGASFKDAQFELLQRDGHGSASLVDLTPGGILRLQDVHFSTCPLTEEVWEVRAGSLTLDSGQHTGVARDASVDFKGVPILYLPWLSFPLDDERKSGFLFPSVGTNSRSGFEVSSPWYWNIAPNEDLLLTPTYYTRRGIDIGGDARYMTDNQHGELVWHFLPYDAQAAGEGLDNHERSYVHLTQTTELPDGFRLQIDAAECRRLTVFPGLRPGPRGHQRPLTSSARRRCRIVIRTGACRPRCSSTRPIDAIEKVLDPTERPYARLPQIVADSDFVVGPAGLLHYGFDSEVVNFDRGIGITGWRMDLRPDATLHFEGPGYFVRPGIAYEFTQYSLDNTALGQPGQSPPLAADREPRQRPGVSNVPRDAMIGAP